MTNIRTLITQLDELREENKKAHGGFITTLCDDCVDYLLKLHNSYEALREAVLDREDLIDSWEETKKKMIGWSDILIHQQEEAINADERMIKEAKAEMIAKTVLYAVNAALIFLGGFILGRYL